MPDQVVVWNDLLILFGRITIATMAIPVIVALIKRRHWNRPLFVAFLYVLATLLINLFEQLFLWSANTYYATLKPYLEYWAISSTVFLSILYYLKDFLLLGWFYSLIFPVVPYNRYILWTGNILAVAATINYLFIEGYNTFGVFNPGADAIFIVVLPFLYLWASQRQSLRITLRKNPYMWISLGLLIPNLLALFLYFTGDYLYESDFVLYAKLFTAKNAFEIIGQVLIAVGFLKARYVRFISIPGGTDPPNIGSWCRVIYPLSLYCH